MSFRHILLKLAICLYNYDLEIKGPLFHRWLPDGEQDAIDIILSECEYIKLWFERRGYINNENYFCYDPQRDEFNTSVMERQGKLEAGYLFGEALLSLNEDEIDTIYQNKQNDNYKKIAKKIINKLYRPISNFIAVLKYQYGQYWLPDLPHWDSRKCNLVHYCSTYLSLKWFDEKNDQWMDFYPGEKRITVYSKLHKIDEFERVLLTKEDWESIKQINYLDNFPLPSLILAKTHELRETGYIRQAFIEGVSALEVAIEQYLKKQKEKYTVLNDNIDNILKSFDGLPLKTKTTILCMIQNLVDQITLKKCLKAIEIRNQIVHDGKIINDDKDGILEELFYVVASIIGRRHKFPSANMGNCLLHSKKNNKNSN